MPEFEEKPEPSDAELVERLKKTVEKIGKQNNPTLTKKAIEIIKNPKQPPPQNQPS